jgi:tetratricopeptide (TPR) repeat protein
LKATRSTLSLALLSVLVVSALTPAVQAGKAGEIRTRSFKLLNQGVSAYKRGEYATAVEKLSQSAAMALNSFRAHFYLGLALIGDRRYEESIAALTVATDLDPSHLQGIVALGDAYLKHGDLAEAHAAYFRALKLRPEYPPAIDGLARIEESQADDEEAISTYLRAIASDKGYAPAYTHLGDLYLRSNRFEEAVRLLEEAVSIRPDYAPGLNRLALAYGRLGLDNEAISTIQKAMQITPNDPRHPATLGQLQLDQGFVAAAEGSFLKALQLDDGLPEARQGLAEVARRKGQYELALGQIDLALADPRLEAAAVQRLMRFRESIAAERSQAAELEHLADADEATAADYSDLAAIYAGRGMWNEAIELQLMAGDDPAQRERLAYMLFKANRFREAHDIYAGLARSTGGATQEINDGVALAMLGDDEAAVAAYNRALKIEPDHKLARLYLGNALLRLERSQEAVTAYMGYLELDRADEAAERVRRILLQIAPEVLPPSSSPLVPPAPERPPGEEEGGATP